MTPDIKAIRAAAEAATPGPWEYESDDNTILSASGKRIATHQPRSIDVELSQRIKNGHHIATANPATVIALCDEVERLTSALAEPAPVQEAVAWRNPYQEILEANRIGIEMANKVKRKLYTAQQPAPVQELASTSPTDDMNIAQRILHVGGRNNAAGYVEFGSIQAVEALVRQVLRDLPQPAKQEPDTQCKFPQCQTEQYRQALAAQISKELVGVPLLTDAEIVGAGLSVGWLAMHMIDDDIEFARAIEKLVHLKTGLK